MDPQVADPATVEPAPTRAAAPPERPEGGVPPGRVARLPLRARWNLWWRRQRFAWALTLVRDMDGAVVSKAALDGAVLQLGKLPGWVDEVLGGRPRLPPAVPPAPGERAPPP